MWPVQAYMLLTTMPLKPPSSRWMLGSRTLSNDWAMGVDMNGGHDWEGSPYADAYVMAFQQRMEEVGERQGPAVSKLFLCKLFLSQSHRCKPDVSNSTRDLKLTLSNLHAC